MSFSPLTDEGQLRARRWLVSMAAASAPLDLIINRLATDLRCSTTLTPPGSTRFASVYARTSADRHVPSPPPVGTPATQANVDQEAA